MESLIRADKVENYSWVFKIIFFCVSGFCINETLSDLGDE